MNVSTRRLVAVVLALAIVASGAAAYTTIFQAGTGTAYETDSGLVVSTNTDHGLDDANPFNDSSTVYIDGVSFSASGPSELTVDQFRGTRTRLSSIETNASTITVDPDDKSSIQLQGGVTAVSWADAALDNSNQLTYSASSSGTITATGLPASTNWTAATPTGTLIDNGTTSGSGEASIAVSSATNQDVILFTNHAPEASNLSPSNGTQLTTSSTEISVDVSDHEFPTTQGDSVNATLFVDGNPVGSETVTSNTTVNITHEFAAGGDHDYHWQLEDQYGGITTTATQTLVAPETLYVRDVTDPNTLVDANNATVTFFGGDDEETIIQRDASNGTVSLAGLPTDTEFTVTVTADDYYTREVVITSLYDQSNVWLLPRNDTSIDPVEVTFQLNDRTGDFANDDETQLRVQRPIEFQNTTAWRDVIGDDISATSDLPTILDNEQRYRLVISNQDQTRILGSYSPNGPSDPETITIGRISFQGDVDSGTAADASLIEDPDPAVRVMYRDPDQTADELTYRVQNTTTGNVTTVVANTTVPTSNGFTSVTEALPAGATLEGSSYRVDIWAASGGDIVEHRTLHVGDLSGPGDGWTEGIGQHLLTLAGYLFLVSVSYGAGNYSAQLGSLLAVVLAVALTLFGVLSIPHVILGFAGSIALIQNTASPDTT